MHTDTPDVGGQVVDALVGLGFTQKQAEPAVRAVLAAANAPTSTPDILRGALSLLGKK
jgi:Holliday junction DNA helicase RuvA